MLDAVRPSNSIARMNEDISYISGLVLISWAAYIYSVFYRAWFIYPTPGDTIQVKLGYIFPLHFYFLSFHLKPKEHAIISGKR